MCVSSVLENSVLIIGYRIGQKYSLEVKMKCRGEYVPRPPESLKTRDIMSAALPTYHKYKIFNPSKSATVQDRQNMTKNPNFKNY